MGDASRSPMSGADILVQALVNPGVDVVFAYPGGASMPIHQSLTRFADRLRTILPRHEQGGGFMAHGYARDFSNKWLRGGAPSGEPLIGSSDIQSLADLGNAFEVVKGMRVVPFTSGTVIEIAWFTLAPVVPLLLTMVPLEEMLNRLLTIIL